MTEHQDGLGNLFARYHAACPEPEVSADFMPGLWGRIEARRGWTWKVRGYARGLVAAAATLCLALWMFEASPLSTVNPLYVKTYWEALDDDDAPETLTYSDLMHAETGDPL